MKTDRSALIIPAIIFLLSLGLRLYRIESRTEFLGDQGSALSVITDAIENRTLPLHGPQTSTGPYPGPAFYYLITPIYIVSGYNPVAPAVFFAVLGSLSAVILYFLVCQLYGQSAAAAVSLLYSTSPLLVAAEQTMWNPTAIPLLTMVLIYLQYLVWRRSYSPVLYVLVGVTLGILVQLHFTAAFSMFMIPVVFQLAGYKKDNNIPLWKSIFLVSGGVIAVLFPYFLFEAGRKFRDIFEVIRIYLSQVQSIGGSKDLAVGFVQTSGRLFGYITNIGPLNITSALGLGLIGLWIWRSHGFTRILSLYTLLVLTLLSLIDDSIHNHYLFFLLPLPFLAVAALFQNTTKPLKTFIVTLVLILSLYQVYTIIWNRNEVGDILRTTGVVGTIVKKVNGSPFSFTLLSSRSFSDFHYRYFFRRLGMTPMDIYGSGYLRLFLVCEKIPCIDPRDLIQKSAIDVMCFEHHCQISYPQFNLSPFRYLDFIDYGTARIYVYERIK
ncbi:hypothetical protein A2154_02750 [Candidatus Gottesmanbacteria bacterium RBG_16_43_7]|uniref:Glycosyltransferase RgtA/B/C/D-like domain-containing protein n=1 Tax=Candidatus Gottesmanbacteria bacterium RBG_16_43_7 TaxID=1798373 RepID=A0A1F5Z891_9BACT|nr:MAG: hypothetical protein A2154_02750 [Candidatus Gottesmanbacteria bacterium RBG_16_43_7]